MSFEGNIIKACINGHTATMDVYAEEDRCRDCDQSYLLHHTVDQTNGHPQYEEDFDLEDYIEHVLVQAVKQIEFEIKGFKAGADSEAHYADELNERLQIVEEDATKMARYIIYEEEKECIGCIVERYIPLPADE